MISQKERQFDWLLVCFGLSGAALWVCPWAIPLLWLAVLLGWEQM